MSSREPERDERIEREVEHPGRNAEVLQDRKELEGRKPSRVWVPVKPPVPGLLQDPVLVEAEIEFVRDVPEVVEMSPYQGGVHRPCRVRHPAPHESRASRRLISGDR